MLYTPKQVATRLGVSIRAVQRAARAAEIPLLGSVYLFTQPQIEQLKGQIRGIAGNPNFILGNELWRNRKKSTENGVNLLT